MDSGRVRLYELDQDSQWTDKGTGIVDIAGDTGAHLLVVTHEDDHTDLLRVPVSPDTVYEIQQGTVMQWTDAPHEYALSFEGADTCIAFYQTIQQIQLSMNETATHSSPEPMDSNENGMWTQSVTLPEPTVSNLDAILGVVVELQGAFDRPYLITALMATLAKDVYFLDSEIPRQADSPLRFVRGYGHPRSSA